MDKIVNKEDIDAIPLVSIITVVYNAVSTIETTIQSVVDQQYDEVEYIIIDGGSTDGTIDIIKKYNDKIALWISEPDNGIYDAMNKGVAYAKGKWILNINAGDTLISIPVEILSKTSIEQFAAICGSVLLDNKVKLKAKYNWTLKIRNTLPHQSLFYNKKMIYADYNLNYKVYADFAYNLGMRKRSLSVKIINEIVSNHSTDGVSHNRNTADELFSVIKTEEGRTYLFLSYLYFRINGLIYRLKKVFHV